MTTKIKKLNPFIINYAGTKYRESIETFNNDDIDFNFGNDANWSFQYFSLQVRLTIAANFNSFKKN